MHSSGRCCSSLLLCGWVIFCLSACSTVGAIEDRAESVNGATADYQARAILYNILRASEAEPLNFVSLTGVTGHNTFSAGIGLPTVIVGPGRTPSQNLFLFGPNTIGGSVSNDFNVSVVDDPTSLAALLRPTDPATIGFLINENNSLRDVLFMFISNIELRDKSGNRLYVDVPIPRDKDQNVVEPDSPSWQDCLKKVAAGPQPQAGPSSGMARLFCSFDNDPLQFDGNDFSYDSAWQPGFYAALNYYVDAGLTAIVAPTYVPQPIKGTPSPGDEGYGQFCFDPAQITYRAHQAGFAIQREAQCKLGSLFPSTPPKGDLSGKGQPAMNAAVKPPPADRPQQQVKWEFRDPSSPDVTIHVYTRSVNGAYRFLGEIYRITRQNDFAKFNPLPYLKEEDPFKGSSIPARMLYITPDLSGCWTSISHETYRACVPANAIQTKRTFALLHQLFVLYASPNNTPVTQTVRATPP
jgi:hypothetical protein